MVRKRQGKAAAQRLSATLYSTENPGIFYWMLASTYRDKHLDVDTRQASAYRCFGLLVLVSSIRCFLLDNTGFQLERHDLIVAQLPYLAAAIPLPTRLLDPFSHFPLGKTDAHPHNRVRRHTRCGRLPLALRDNDLHGFEPLLPLRIVAIAHAPCQRTG